MTHDRSDRVWDSYWQAGQKLDYFILGIASALTAYLGKDLNLTPLDLNSSTAELMAVLCFAGSMFCGFKRIEWNVVSLGGSFRQLHHGEAAGALLEASGRSSGFINAATGDLLGPGAAILRAQQHQQTGAKLKLALDKAINRAEAAYKSRNRLLYAGILLLIMSRVLKGYVL